MLSFTKITTAYVLVLSLGLHWALLQTVAWTGMVISYSQRGSLHDAISMTFDGKHPCPLCKAIQKGRAEEHKPSSKTVSSVLKQEPAVLWQEVATILGAEQGAFPTPQPENSPRYEEPPKPPPRLS